MFRAHKTHISTNHTKALILLAFGDCSCTACCVLTAYSQKELRSARRTLLSVQATHSNQAQRELVSLCCVAACNFFYFKQNAGIPPSAKVIPNNFKYVYVSLGFSWDVYSRQWNSNSHIHICNLWNMCSRIQQGHENISSLLMNVVLYLQCNIGRYRKIQCIGH